MYFFYSLFVRINTIIFIYLLFYVFVRSQKKTNLITLNASPIFRKELVNQESRYSAKLEDAEKRASEAQTKVYELKLRLDEVEREVCLKECNVDREYRTCHFTWNLPFEAMCKWLRTQTQITWRWWYYFGLCRRFTWNMPRQILQSRKVCFPSTAHAPIKNTRAAAPNDAKCRQGKISLRGNFTASLVCSDPSEDKQWIHRRYNGEQILHNGSKQK